MRINDPKVAQLIVTVVELDLGDTKDVKMVWWNRSTDKATEITGRLVDVEMKARPLDEEDNEWLDAIGARKA